MFADTEQIREVKTAFLSTVQKIFARWCEGGGFTKDLKKDMSAPFVEADACLTVKAIFLSLIFALIAGQT